MADLRDPEQAERLEQSEPDAYLRRREFLQRTAVAAGATAALGTVLNPDALVAAAASRQRRRPLPAPKNLPVDTFVVLMMENRSFDHYLGWLPGADGRQAGLSYADKNGAVLATQHLQGDFQGCAHPDPDHSWKGGRTQFNGGKMDGFLRSGDNDVFSVSYYEEKDLGFLPSVAKEFTTFDRFHCSLLAGTYPNREYMHAAQSYGQTNNALPPEAGYANGYPDNTIFAALKAKGIDAKYFFNDLPVSAFWGTAGIARSARIEEYYARAKAGTLPALSFVDPSFLNEEGGTSGDEHPHGDVRTGQAFVSDVVHAFLESPQYKSGALFIVYDEWGGFFDHVAPPRVPDQRSDRDIDKDFGQMGMRIPSVVVSPYARRGAVEHSIHGFESILKMIEYRYALKPLTRRDAYAHNIARSFDWESKPRLDIPSLPDPVSVVSQQCPGTLPGLRSVPGSSGPGEGPQRPKEHDMAALLHSGFLDHLGFEYKRADATSTFREPSKVEQAIAAAP